MARSSASPVKQFKNVTFAGSSCNLKMLPMLPVAAGAVGMWESGVLAFAGFPSAEGNVGNSLLFFEFSTLSSARHFHSAWALFFPRIRTRAPPRLRPRERGRSDGRGLGRGADRDVLSGSGRRRGHRGLPTESEDLLQLDLNGGRELKRVEAVSPLLQLRQPHRIRGPRSHQTLRRRLRRFVRPPQP